MNLETLKPIIDFLTSLIIRKISSAAFVALATYGVTKDQLVVSLSGLLLWAATWAVSWWSQRKTYASGATDGAAVALSNPAKGMEIVSEPSNKETAKLVATGLKSAPANPQAPSAEQLKAAFKDGGIL